MTAPGWEDRDLRDAFIDPGQDPRSFRNHPVTPGDFNELPYERHTGPRHQVGGYAQPVQGPVEYESPKPPSIGPRPWALPGLPS